MEIFNGQIDSCFIFQSPYCPFDISVDPSFLRYSWHTDTFVDFIPFVLNYECLSLPKRLILVLSSKCSRINKTYPLYILVSVNPTPKPNGFETLGVNSAMFKNHSDLFIYNTSFSCPRFRGEFKILQGPNHFNGLGYNKRRTKYNPSTVIQNHRYTTFLNLYICCSYSNKLS